MLIIIQPRVKIPSMYFIVRAKTAMFIFFLLITAQQSFSNIDNPKQKKRKVSKAMKRMLEGFSPGRPPSASEMGKKFLSVETRGLSSLKTLPKRISTSPITLFSQPLQITMSKPLRIEYPFLSNNLHIKDRFSTFCNYGGYLSTIDDNGKCKEPWRINKENLGLFSPLYVEYLPCESADIFRCNPFVYGTLKEHQDKKNKLGNDLCVQIESRNEQEKIYNVDTACRQGTISDNSLSEINVFLDEILNNTKLLADYLASALISIKNCIPSVSRECSSLREIVNVSVNSDVIQNLKLNSVEIPFYEMRPSSLRDHLANLCNYGGYLSIFKDGICERPWKIQQGDLGWASTLFSKYDYCRQEKVVRCSPILYGTESEGKGYCIFMNEEENEYNPWDIIKSCNRAIFEEREGGLEYFIDQMLENPEHLTTFLVSSLISFETCPSALQVCSEIERIVDISFSYIAERINQDQGLMFQLFNHLKRKNINVDLLNKIAWKLNNNELGRMVTKEFSWEERRSEIINDLMSKDYEETMSTWHLSSSESNKEISEEEEGLVVDDSYLNLLPPPSDIDDKVGHLCAYGGYLSAVKNVVRCKSPWTVKKHDLKEFAPLYIKYNICGERNMIRCNPFLYGTLGEHREDNNRCLDRPGDEDGPGCCIKLPPHKSEDNAYDATYSCNEALLKDYPEKVGSLVNKISQDPKRLAEYLTTSLIITENCQEGEQKCTELQTMVETSFEFVSKKFKEINGLSSEVLKNMADLKLDVDIMNNIAWLLKDDKFASGVASVYSWEQRRMALFDTIIKRIEEDERTKNVIATAQRRARRKSRGLCYHYVKQSLVAGGMGKGYLDQHYYWRRAARHAKEELKEFGFINLLDYGYPSNPDEFPIGSILVYNGGRYGHVEIVSIDKSGEREYISDFKARNPIHLINANRNLTAIMIPIMDEERALLDMQQTF